MKPVRVLLMPASGPDIGGGHVLRGLALAAALRERGAVCGFAVEAEGARLVSRFGAGMGAEAVSRGDGPVATADAWGADAVIVDDYRTGAESETGLATPSRLLVAIDDLADRPHRASLLIDPSHGRDPRDYGPLLPPGATVLSGAAYALLRPAFADASPIVIRPHVERVFVGFGLADPGGVTLPAMRALLPALPRVRFDVAMGGTGESLPALRDLAAREPRLVLHVETDDAAALMGRADMAIGAGGASTWERFRLGLPSLCLIVADNQRALSLDLAAQGFHLALQGGNPGWETRLAAMATALAGDEGLRRRLSGAARSLCDGEGARRAAEAILQAASEAQR